MKKGQLITQVFIYVVAAVVFLSILLFGYSAITNLLQSQDLILLADFKSDLESDVEKLIVRRGSVEINEYRLPLEFHTLCIADTSGKGAGFFEMEYPQFARAWRSNTENVFLQPKQNLPFFIPHVEIEQGFFCMDIKGTFKLRLEGGGRTVKVAPA